MTGPKLQRRQNAAYIIEENSVSILGQSGRERIGAEMEGGRGERARWWKEG